jgi:uncharacterized protein
MVESGLQAVATLNDSATAAAIYAKLPMESQAERWGDEVYFGIPIQHEPEDPQAEVPSGTIAFWPPGSAFCIFFGQTPYSPVNVIGMIEGDPRIFWIIPDGETVRVERVE